MAESDMPTLSRALFWALCTRINAESGQILDRHQPSLTWLQRRTGMCRTSVRNHLYRLEEAGWMTSFPPDPHTARAEHARTRYVLHRPGSAEFRAARGQQRPADRRSARRARAAMAIQRAGARKAPGRGAALDAPQPRRGPAVPAASRPGSTSPAIAAAIERARLADEAPPKPTPIPDPFCRLCTTSHPPDRECPPWQRK